MFGVEGGTVSLFGVIGFKDIKYSRVYRGSTGRLLVDVMVSERRRELLRSI